MEKIDIHELIYKDIIISKKMNFTNALELDMSIFENTREKVNEIFERFLSVKSKNTTEEIHFSDLIYDKCPIIERETNIVNYIYKPILNNKNTNENIDGYINRFKIFDINKLPLIEVANELKIKVEKSNTLKSLGVYIHNEKKIVLASDYAPTFIHELVHAIDFILPERINENGFSELVAEISVVILCKLYSIQNDDSYSMSYLNSYATFTTFRKNNDDSYSMSYLDSYATSTALRKKCQKLIERVMQIIEYIKKCKDKITSKNNGI